MTYEPLRVDTHEFKRICDGLLDHLRDSVGTTASLPSDYFWSIDPDERHDVEVEPTTFTIGQLSECWSNLQSLDEESTISYALVWLGQITSSHR